MKKAYIVVILLVILGIFASFFMIPRSKEVALVTFKDAQYEKARGEYQQLVDSGAALTHDVVQPLVDLHLKNGAVNDAILVLEKYTEQNPNNIEALKELGKLYQYAQRQDDYVKNLERMSKIESSEQILLTLSDIYNYNQDYQKQAEVLMELIKSGKQFDPKQYLDLANILASSKKPQDAVLILQKLKADHPDKMPYEAIALLVSLDMDAGNFNQGYEDAVFWREHAKDNTSQVAKLVNIIHFRGSPELAQQLIAPYAEKIFEDPALLEQQVLIYIATERTDEAYELLERFHSEGKLSPSLYNSYLILAVQRGDVSVVEELSEFISPENMVESEAIVMTELSILNHYKTLLGAINNKLGVSEYRSAYPVFDIVLDLANHAPEAQEKIDAFVAKGELTDAQRLTIARNCAYAGKQDCALSFLSEFEEEGKELSGQRVADIGDLYIALKQYEKGLAFVESRRTPGEHQAVERTWARLAASQGKRDEVNTWNAEQQTVPMTVLSDEYFLAMAGNHSQLAVDVSEVLFKQQNTPKTRSMLSNAYIRNGQFDDALAVLEQGGELDEDASNAYLQALIAQAARDPSYRSKLADYASKELANAKTEKRRLALIYALIDNGRMDVAMPFIKQYAMTQGGSWAYLYAENLTKRGKMEEAREFWLMLAKNPRTSEKEKRTIAYSLLESGFKEDAILIFGELAANKGPASDEVKQVLYLWGPRLNEDRLSWLYARADTTSDPAEYHEWLRLIGNNAGDEALVTFVGNNPNLAQEPAIFRPYLEALWNSGQKDQARTMLTSLQERAASPEELREFAHFALDYGMQREAAAAYRALAEQNPEDEEALREVGISAYNLADYKTSKDFLGRYLVLRQNSMRQDEQSYKAYYNYAELLTAEKNKEEAVRYYEAVLSLLEKNPARTADMESKYYQSMARLGRMPEAVSGFEAAIARYPEDGVLRGDFASAMVEQEQYEHAWQVLEMPASTMENSQEMAPMVLDGRSFTAYQQLSGQREVLLAFNPAQPPVGIEQEMLPAYPWLGYVTNGYDRYLVVAKPEYRLEVVRAKDGQLLLVPHKIEEQGADSLQAQTRLRYELLKARIELETDKPYAAVDRLNALAPDYPNDPQLMGFTANAENFVGRWPRALRLLNEAQAISPENEDIASLKRDIEKLHAQHIKLDHEWKALGDNDEQITTLSGFANVGNGVDVGMVVQNDHVDTTTIRRADGRVGQFKDDKQNAELFVRFTNDDGSNVKGSLFANNDTVGFGGYVAFISNFGESLLGLEWHRPYLDFVEGVLDDATRDRVFVGQGYRLDRKTFLSGELGFNRYNVEDNDDVASALQIEAQISREVRAENPNLNVGFGVDAEYLTDKETLDAGGGDFYRPLPIRSREVYFLSLSGRHDFTQDTYADFLLGYAYDRLGGNGPVVEGRLTHELTEDLDVQVRAAYGLGAGETDDNVSRVGAYILYRY